MKLTWEVTRLNLAHTWTIARGSSDYKENVIVQLEHQGITGYGEAAPNVRYNETPDSTIEVLEQSIPLLEGADPWRYVDLGQSIQQLAEGQTAAKAALDIALMDWVAKALKVPYYRFLGLDPATAPITTYSIGLATPEKIAEKVRGAADFPFLKVKASGDRDEEVIGAVRSVTDKPLLVDANEGWHDREEALEKIGWLQSEGVTVMEQPMPAAQLDDIRWLRERVDIPLIADESVKTARDIPALASAFDGINIKVMKSGGLQEALRMVWLARALGMQVMLGCMVETSIAVSAAACLSPLADYADLDGNLLIANDPFEGVQVNHGQLVLNERPGIGVKRRKSQ